MTGSMISSDQPRVAYIGLNHHHCTPYLQSLAQLPVEISSAFTLDESIDSASIDGLPSVPVFNNLEELISKMDIDVAVVTLSNRQTPAALETLIESGIDVFVEKPAARNAADLEALVSKVERAAVTVGVSYPWRWHPIANELRDRASAGFFGDTISLSLRFFAAAIAHRDPSHYLYDVGESRGGIVQWLGVHWIDLLPWIFDDPIARVRASLHHEEDIVDIDTRGEVSFETNAGVTGTLECGYTLDAGTYDTWVDIQGNVGRAEWDPIGEQFGFEGETSLTLEHEGAAWAAAPRRRIIYEYNPAPGYGGRWGRDFIEAFFDARETEHPVPVSLKDALDVLRVLDAIYQSARDEDWIEVE